jgi:hypothetical protein
MAVIAAVADVVMAIVAVAVAFAVGSTVVMAEATAAVFL